MSVMKPAIAPSQAHCRTVRRSRVAIHAHTKPATAAIEGPCVMLGSLIRYHRMNEPSTASADANAARRAPKNRAVSRKQNQQPSSP
jgi:hypothetical protein